jgi:hypothetical protein
MDRTLLQTGHAVHRQAQRNLSDRDVQFVLEYGRRIYCAGVLHIFLAQRDIPSDKWIQRRYGRLEGTTLVMDTTDEDELVLITAYRNRRALKNIRSKAKYDKYQTTRGKAPIISIERETGYDGHLERLSA